MNSYKRVVVAMVSLNLLTLSCTQEPSLALQDPGAQSSEASLDESVIYQSNYRSNLDGTACAGICVRASPSQWFYCEASCAGSTYCLCSTTGECSRGGCWRIVSPTLVDDCRNNYDSPGCLTGSQVCDAVDTNERLRRCFSSDVITQICNGQVPGNYRTAPEFEQKLVECLKAKCNNAPQSYGNLIRESCTADPCRRNPQNPLCKNRVYECDTQDVGILFASCFGSDIRTAVCNRQTPANYRSSSEFEQALGNCLKPKCVNNANFGNLVRDWCAGL